MAPEPHPRLNRFLARAGLGSRRAVESLVLAGRVRVKVRRRPDVEAPTLHDFSPEYDDLARLARDGKGTLRSLEDEARAAAVTRWRER